MAVGEIEVVNRALTFIGEPPITSLDDDTKGARQAKTNLPLARSVVLRSHFWKFATARVRLPQLAEAPAFGWKFAFQLPSDFVRLWRVNPGGPNAQVLETPYRIEGDRLLTDDSEINIIYMRDVTDLSKWDPLAQEALAYRLAADISMVIVQNANITQQLQQQFDRVLAEARSTDSMENPSRELEANEWVASRFGIRDFPFRPIEDS